MSACQEIEFGHDLFLSHTGLDKDWVRALGERLEQEGIEDRDDSRRIKVFFDEWDINYGANIVNRLNEGLARSEDPPDHRLVGRDPTREARRNLESDP